MRALVCTAPGNLNAIQIIELPILEPKANQVQIAVRAVGLSTSDFGPFVEMQTKGKVSFASKLLTASKPFGGDVAGVVTKVGTKVTKFKVGDAVYAAIGVNGGCAEYVAVDADKVCAMPSTLSFEEAAAVPTAGIVAMEACKKAGIAPGKSVLVYGASGGVGQFCVQIAKAMGGTVMAVCSTRNVKNAYSLGADDVIDYKKTNIAACERRFDAVLGVNGNVPLHVYKKLLAPGGTYVAIGGQSATAGLFGPLYALGSGKHMTFVLFALAQNHGHLEALREMVEQGKIKPFVENTFTPKDAHGEISKIVKNHAQGKNIVSIKF